MYLNYKHNTSSKFIVLYMNLHVVEDLGLLKSTPINAASNNHSPKRWRILLHRGRFSANTLDSINKNIEI